MLITVIDTKYNKIWTCKDGNDILDVLFTRDIPHITLIFSESGSCRKHIYDLAVNFRGTGCSLGEFNDFLDKAVKEFNNSGTSSPKGFNALDDLEKECFSEGKIRLDTGIHDCYYRFIGESDIEFYKKDELENKYITTYKSLIGV